MCSKGSSYVRQLAYKFKKDSPHGVRALFPRMKTLNCSQVAHEQSKCLNFTIEKHYSTPYSLGSKHNHYEANLNCQIVRILYSRAYFEQALITNVYLYSKLIVYICSVHTFMGFCLHAIVILLFVLSDLSFLWKGLKTIRKTPLTA